MSDADETKVILSSLDALEEMRSDGLIGEFAIGGSLAVSRAVGPIKTEDIDFMATVLTTTASGLIDPSQIWRAFMRHGFHAHRQWVQKSGYDVEIVPAEKDYEREALANAVGDVFEGRKVKVIRPEYMLLIKLIAWRKKDRYHAQLLLDTDLDWELVERLVTKYNLRERYEKLRADE